MVILNLPTTEETKDSHENYTYLITAITQSQKSAPPKVPGSRNSQPSSRVTKLVGRNSVRSLQHHMSRNLDRLNKRTMRSPFFFPPPPEDEEMEDSAMIRGDSYGMRGALPLVRINEFSSTIKITVFMTSRYLDIIREKYPLPQGPKKQPKLGIIKRSPKKQSPLKWRKVKPGFILLFF